MTTRSGLQFKNPDTDDPNDPLKQILDKLNELSTNIQDIWDRATILETNSERPPAQNYFTPQGSLTCTPQPHDIQHMPPRFNPCYQENNNVVFEKDIIKRVKIDAPNFHRKFDPKAFMDWLIDMDQYFDWYEMSNNRWVHFVKMKLTGITKQYWIGIERNLEWLEQDPITLQPEMKAKLK